ncbi:hypothetical protein F0562_009700 [Nyssa sinensis]|uniref:RING-type E3 ubiquitin transferase n=1 Tax=Nyssa sinensis TaxID=561372 RepID=A0A5J5A1S3_9ASTE|nr:hypothetical protein F0562_009700 [Nyssa sinensis]
MKVKYEEIFIPFKKLCKTRKVETLVLEGDSPASALLRYISDSGIRSLVLGSCCSNFIMRKLKGPGVPSIVLKQAPDTCDIYVVSRHKFITNSASSLSTSGTLHTSFFASTFILSFVASFMSFFIIFGCLYLTERSSRHWLFNQRECGPPSIGKPKSGFYSSLVECKALNTSRASSMSAPGFLTSQAFTHESSPIHSGAVQERNHQSLEDSTSEIWTIKECPSVASIYTEQLDMRAEIEQLRLELQSTVYMYERACTDLVYAQNKVHLLSSECLDEARRMNDALKREETFRKIAAEEKEKHLEAVKEVEMARNLLAKETYERQIAELNALKESLEKQKIVDALFSNDKRYRGYTRDEMESATNFFSETKIIGEGAYGKVYKCNLDHTPVAIKVLQPDASDKKEEFLREVEVLSQLRHPHLVLLLGACPESGCLVYEYMENGSLDDHIFRRSGRPPLPWFVRFRIVFEVACGLAFLHNSKPEPIVHRDIKPGNILLDRNYVSKIGDVGLAKLISDVVPDNITEYRDSILAGTLPYMDPEYQRTGTVRPKSDLYAFGIITGWPLAEAEELARMAMKCSELRCRDRPDLDTEVLPVLKKLADIADFRIEVERNNSQAPSHYYCPILQEVMDDPHIAADGFTYEHRAIKLWVERHNVSPVTKLRLQHTKLTPNHTLRSAIQEWSFFEDLDTDYAHTDNTKKRRRNGDNEAFKDASVKEILNTLLLLDEEEKSDQDKWTVESQQPKSLLMSHYKVESMNDYYNHFQGLSSDLDDNDQLRNKRTRRDAAGVVTAPIVSDNAAPESSSQFGGGKGGVGGPHRRLWVKNRSRAWWEQCNSPDFPEEEFRRAFRMSKATFDMICDELDSAVTKKDTMLRLAIPVRQRVAVCIWRLATGEPLRLVSKRFGLGISTCHKLVLEVCSAIRTVLMHKFLQWPDESKLKEIKNEFELISGIPNVCGSMYTTHVPIIAPKTNVAAYFNKRHTERNQKPSYSITVQGVVDSKGVFTDVCIGWPGSMPDDKVLEKSALSQRASQGLLKDVWIGGNSGYPLMDWVLVPYTHQNLTWTQHGFNEKIGEVQRVSKEAFARLKGRWSCLQKRTEVKLQDLPVVLGACCVLHNICEMRNEEMEPELRFELFDDEMVAENAVRSVSSMQSRDHIAHNLLHYNLAGTAFL